MLIRYVGHACFLIEIGSETRILMDPFQPGAFNGRLGLTPYMGPVDAVISSHGHLDHYHIDPSFGQPVVFTGPGQFRGIEFRCVHLPHGRPDGIDHGMVTVFSVRADGLNLVHMGDVGVLPTTEQMDFLGRPDILLVPAGGRFTLDAAQAARLITKWHPAIAVPMHCADPDVDIELAPVSEFIAFVDNVDFVGDIIQVAAPLDGEKVLVMRRAGMSD